MTSKVKRDGRRRPRGVAVASCAAFVGARAGKLPLLSLTLLLLVVLTAQQAAVAEAAFVPKMQAWTSTQQAGAPVKLNLRFHLDPFEPDQMKSMVLKMPPGMFADPGAPPAPYCDESELDRYEVALNRWREAYNDWATGGQVGPEPKLPPRPCPDATVGSLTLLAMVEGVTLPVPGYGIVLNARPKGDNDGRVIMLFDYIDLPLFTGTFRNALNPPIRIEDNVKLRDTSDFGMDNLVTNIPDRIPMIGPDELSPIKIAHLTLTLDGTIGHNPANPPDNHPFLTNPTTCGVHSLKASITSHAGSVRYVSAQLPVRGCSSMDFSPEMTATFDPAIPNNTSALNVTVTQSPLGEAHMASSTVTMPAGINILSKIKPCPRPAAAAAACPATSRIGGAVANAQALTMFGPLTGDVFLVEPDGGGNLGLLMTLRGLVSVNILAKVVLDAATGRMTTEFKGLPPMPMTELRLTIDGGSNSLIKTPVKCGDYAVKGRFRSHSGLLHASDTALTIPCPVEPFKKPPRPSVSVKFTKRGDMRISVRAKGDARLKKVSALVRKLIKKKAIKTKRRRSRFVKKLRKNKKNRPKKALYRITSKGITVRSRSKKGAKRFVFTVRRGFIKHRRSCKKKLRIRVRTSYTDSTKYQVTRKPRPSKRNCGRKSKKRSRKGK